MEESEQQIAQLKAEVAELREALEDISDHNSALERMNFIRAQGAEIERLRALLERAGLRDIPPA